MDFGVRGKTVLITGGASGIGRAISELFGQEGANVALTYLSSEKGAKEVVAAIESAGGQALPLHADVSKEAEVERVVRSTVERFGQIDILIANAGGLLKRSSVKDCTLQLWERALTINLTSTFLCCRAVLPYMERARRGVIITMSSLAAHNGGGNGSAHYAAAKGGILTFTRSLAREVGPLGIRVNGLAPGLIATQFHDRFSTAEMRQASVNGTPLRREGQASDVAGAALFLASPCADFISGETIEINGGLGLY
jgi:3-oxoacyl-[acyl-carrier protein] reductase